MAYLELYSGNWSATKVRHLLKRTSFGVSQALTEEAISLGLSATIGNPKALADWLEAKLVIDTWRPVKLHKGIFMDGEVEMY